MTSPSDDSPENGKPAPEAPAPKEFQTVFTGEIPLAAVLGLAAGLCAGAVVGWALTRRH